MADERSKLDEFKARIAGSVGRVAANPMIQGMANVAIAPGAGNVLSLAGADRPRPMTSFERTSPTQADMTAPQAQNPAPYPFNSGGGEAYAPTPAAPGIPAPGTARMGAAVGANPMSGLRGRLNEAQLATMEGLDQDAELQRDQGDAKAKKMEQFAKLYEQQAADQEIDARMQQQADFDAKQKHVAFLERNEKLANDIGEQKIDPGRLMRSKSTAEKGLFVVSSILGGALRGLDGGRNDALDRMDKEIDQDINAQQSAIDNKKASMSARQSLFGQMLQETGDSRVATMQTRNLMYESFKQKLLSEGERSNIPEVKINAEQGARAIQAKQDANRENLAASALQQAQQAAAAAAGARAAAEKDAWKRSMEVSELALKKDELEIKRAASNKESGKDVDRQVESLAKDLADPKLASGRAPVEALRAQLSQTPADQGIAGVGLSGDIRANMLGGLGSRVLLSDQERVNRGNWDKVKLAYQSQITGSGASDAERKMLSQAFEGAKSAAEQRAAIQSAESLFKQQEERRMAGASPDAQAIFRQRLAAQDKGKK